MKLEQELVILGLLLDKPRHGYEIRKQINEFLTYFAGLEYESIYYSLRSLERKGLVNKQVSASRNRPDKFIYALTDQGKERFKALLDRSFLHIQRPYFGIDISLFFLPHLKSEDARRKLRARLRILKRIELALSQAQPTFRTQKPAHLLAILEHNLELIKAEIAFIASLIDKLS